MSDNPKPTTLEPKEQATIRPLLEMVLRPEGSPPIALGFRLPRVSGIPDPYSQLSAGLTLAAEAQCFSHLPKLEVDSTLAALSEAYVRSRYHKLRFDDCLETTKVRRAALGGPVVSDWTSVPPLIWEASAFLGAARTAVDVLIYLAARRAGKSENTADRWDATEAILPKTVDGGMSPTRYDVAEVLIIRSRNPWFEKLNLYRNVVFHRGLENDRWGFYSRQDTAVEAYDPKFNAMLIPDEQPLRDRKRSHDWTYTACNRLDDLVEELETGLSEIFLEVLTLAWKSSVPAPGKMPKHEQPNSILRLPRLLVLEYADCRAISVFETKIAAREFKALPTDSLILRAVLPTKIGDDPPAFLFPADDSISSLPWKVHLYGMVRGRLVRKQSLDADPSQGPVSGIISIRIRNDAASVLYVWESPPKRQ